MAASTLFAVALLASGQSATIVGTLAGQVVMEGFMRWRVSPATRRLITRSLAIVPTVIFIAVRGAGNVNAAILIVAGATFHSTGYTQVAEIGDAYKLLTPLLGGGASTVFALALLASGQNSTLTGTLAGQIVMEGFLNIRLRPWVRRLITRLLAIVPAAVVAILYGESGTNQLLILSQVILSLQLSFAVFPLVTFTSERAKMGEFTNSRLLKLTAWTMAFVIAALNAWLLVQSVRDWFA